MPKVRKVSLHLARSADGALTDILTERAHELISSGRARTVVAEGFADDAILVLFPGVPKEPPWVSDIAAVFKVDEEVRRNLRSVSPAGMYIFDKDKKRFAATFGYSHAYLKDAALENDFGLKVAVNYIADAKVKEIEKTNLGLAIRDLAQSAVSKDLDVFELDEVLNVIRRISGESKSGKFAKKVTGARALKFSRELELVDVPTIALQAHKIYKSKKYKSTKFAIIDHLSPVVDPIVLSNLDDKLVHILQSGGGEFELSMPEIIPDAAGSYKYRGFRDKKTYVDVDISHYINGVINSNNPNISLDRLRNDSVVRLSQDDETDISSSSIYRSLVGSLDLLGYRYTIDEGVWYRFVDAENLSVDHFIAKHQVAPPEVLPIYTTIKKDKKIALEPEEEWNIKAATSVGGICLDKKGVSLESMPGSNIEICDILDLKNRRLVHVKRSFRKSSALSHLFKQGHNAARLLRNDDFRLAAIEKLREVSGDDAADDFANDLHKPESWTIAFWLADLPKANGQIEMPFFSRLTFRSEAKKILLLGYKVEISFVPAKPK